MNNSDNNQNKPKFISLDNNQFKNANSFNISEKDESNFVNSTVSNDSIQTDVANNTDTKKDSETNESNNNVMTAIPLMSPISKKNEDNQNNQATPQTNENAIFNQISNTNTQVNNQQVQANNQDQNEVNDEKLKTVEIDYKPPSKFQTIILLLFFLILIAFVIFLPQVTNFIQEYRSHKVVEEKILDGKLLCSLNTSTSELSYGYNATFTFRENKLLLMRFESETKGDLTDDEDKLNDLNLICIDVESRSKSISGLTVTCNYSGGLLKEVETYELKSLNTDDLNSAFIEAGGSKIEYQYGDDMDQIEKEMKRSGYTCEREK